jgi:hypothetical protein
LAKDDEDLCSGSEESGVVVSHSWSRHWSAVMRCLGSTMKIFEIKSFAKE